MQESTTQPLEPCSTETATHTNDGGQMSKWRVEKFTGWRTTSSWRVVSHCGVIADYFPTHRMAIDYADRMARTMAATLPRLGDSVDLGRGKLLELHDNGGAALRSGLGAIGIHKNAQERVALALLAHSRRNA